MKRFDCVFVGLNTVDSIALLPGALKEDEKIQAGEIALDGGGPAGTAACAASRFGLKTSVCAVIGKDRWLPFVLENFQAYSVDSSLSPVSDKAATPFSMIFVNPKTAARTIIWNAAAVYKFRFRPGRRLKAAVISAKAVHFDGHLMDLSIELAKIARKNGVLVSYDCGSAKKDWEVLARNTDIFIASHKFAAQLGLAVPRAVERLKKRFGFRVAFTCGAKGVYYYDDNRGRVEFLRQRRFNAVDTTGCGDVFHGAFLARHLGGADFAASLKFAQLAAGLKTLKLGGRRGMPETVAGVRYA